MANFLFAYILAQFVCFQCFCSQWAFCSSPRWIKCYGTICRVRHNLDVEVARDAAAAPAAVRRLLSTRGACADAASLRL